jgi:hypothetical protein
MQENPELSNKRTARIAELDAAIEAKEAELKRLKAEIIEIKDEEEETPAVEITVEEEKPVKISRGRGGRGLGKGSYVYEEKLTPEEKILAKYDAETDLYKKFNNEREMLEFLLEALKNADKLRHAIQWAIRDLLSFAGEECKYFTLRDLVKLTTLKNANFRYRFDNMIECCDHVVVGEYKKFFETVLDEKPTMIWSDKALFKCWEVEMAVKTEKTYRLAYESQEDDE